MITASYTSDYNRLIPFCRVRLLDDSHGCEKRAESNLLRHYDFLKNLPPFLPMPVLIRLEARRDLVSGLHFSSLRVENKVKSAGDTSPSFMFLHDIKLRFLSSVQERITCSRPSVVSSEHPSKDKTSTLLEWNINKHSNQTTLICRLSILYPKLYESKWWWSINH